MPEPEQYTVAVRTLCAFTARRGDLDLRFTPGPTAIDGMVGHAIVTARRPSGYESELTLQASHGGLSVRGRADGYDPARHRLEEIKTHRGALDRQPENLRHLHWAQLQTYGWLLCLARGLERITLALVYFDLASQRETVLEEMHEATALRELFEQRCERYIAWARQEAAHRQARQQALAALGFPHPQFRPGQRRLSEDSWRAASQGRCLMVQAPTGIGKTMGTLFPMLKAIGVDKLDRVVFVAARTPGRQLALDALTGLRSAGARPLRVLELVARDKACEHPELACHGESCPLARGFYDRLAAARADAVAQEALDGPALREVARRHSVCPYWLSHEMAHWCDLIVGDYNYWFDASALLHALALQHEWRCGLLVDEAHNLLERGRAMYSAELDEHQLVALRRTAPGRLRAPLDRLSRAWREAACDLEGDHALRDELPPRLPMALQHAASAIADHLAEAGAASAGADALQQFMFDLLALSRLCEGYGEHSVFELRRLPGRGVVRTRIAVRNLVPAPWLAPRVRTAHATVLFSATLGPPAFYRDMLGLPADTVWTEVDSPFDAAQLAVRVMPSVSTRWADRDRSLAPIAGLIAEQWARQPGNYLAFFSSHEYLQRAAAQLAQDHPQVPMWTQSAGMSEAERSAFLARFTEHGSGVGFAVLGGSFGEGIDLPGTRLIGAFIATLGLPQVNAHNELLRSRLQRSFGRGFDYAYLYPGLRKVVQAAGRVIRTPEDRGTVWLIDDRWLRPEVRALLPAWWHVGSGDAAARDAVQLSPIPAG